MDTHVFILSRVEILDFVLSPELNSSFVNFRGMRESFMLSFSSEASKLNFHSVIIVFIENSHDTTRGNERNDEQRMSVG